MGVGAQLYRHFDSSGTLLYVGVSLSAVGRLAQHRDTSHWFAEISKIEIENHPSRVAALSAEKAAIASEHPKHNLVHTKFGSLTIISRYGESRDDLLNKIVKFDPLYSIDEVARILKTSNPSVKKLIAAGELGGVERPHGNQRRLWVTGWQLIEYFEYLESLFKIKTPRGQKNG